MVAESVTITIDPESELAQALSRTDDDAPVRLDIRGKRYRISPEDESDLFANYDVKGVLAGLRAGRGALRGIDREKLLADLREQR